MSLEFRAISKSYGSHQVLKDVSLSAKPGECLVLMGENGAGKSTLMKILSGIIPQGQFEGEVIWREQELRLQNSLEAQAQGIAMIHQELNLFPQLSVLDNFFLGREPIKLGSIDRDLEKRELEIFLKNLGWSRPWNLESDLSTLGPGDRQLLEIAKSLHLGAGLIVFDEPSSSLTQDETERLFQIIDDLKAQNKTILYISHRMNEIFRVADSIAVLRDGFLVAQKRADAWTQDSLVSAMVGRELKDVFPKKSAETVKSPSYQFLRSEAAILECRPGEILGIGGLMGSGRSELLRSFLGIGSEATFVAFQGQKFFLKSPVAAKEYGIVYLSEDRKLEGIFSQQNIFLNAVVSSLKNWRSRMWTQLPWVRIQLRFQELCDRFRVKMPGADFLMSSLSGGNQQKVLLLRAMALNPKVLLLDEPTRGVDVGARQEIYTVLRDLCDQGLAIVMVSSDLPELMGLSDRILVMHEGRIAGEMAREEFQEEKFMSLATGWTQS